MSEHAEVIEYALARVCNIASDIIESLEKDCSNYTFETTLAMIDILKIEVEAQKLRLSIIGKYEVVP